MIKVKFVKNQEVITGFAISGHAEFGPKGTDIICSAISTLSQTGVLALNEVAGVEASWDKRDGYLTCQLPENLEQRCLEDSQVILKTIYAGIHNVARQYPEYVKLMVKRRCRRV